jgi:nucleoside diphosphate kinase
MERTAYVIKPEGMACRSQIRQILLDDGLRIVSNKRVILDPAAVDTLYPGLAPDLRNASIRFLTCAPVEFGILEGENVIAKLRRLMGDETNPDECSPGTIRHRFGIRPGIIFGSATYYFNVIHGSKDTDEASRDLRLYSSLAPAPPSLQ